MSTDKTWSCQRLADLITSKIEESVSLDYKAAAALDFSDKKKREIAKDVSAMANSNGGTIIYGIAEFPDDARKHLPERIDPVSRKSYSKEWLESVVSGIKPRIENLRITPVEIPPSADNVVYVVDVPKSCTAHQATDFRYYKRYNFESVPMYDFEIRDILNRRRFPKLEVKASLVFARSGNEGALHFEIHNIGDVLASRFAAIVHVPAPLIWQNRQLIFNDGTLVKIEGESALRLNKFHNAIGTPLFPFSLREENFKFFIGEMQPLPKKSISNIRYKVYADDMPFLEGSFLPAKIFRQSESF